MFRHFLRSRGGNVALYFAVAALPITILVGSAVDLARGNNAKQHVREALDLAVLAAATDMTRGAAEEEATATGANVFADNIATLGIKASCNAPVITADARTHEITGRADCTMPLTFAAVIGRDEMDLDPEAAAIYGGKVEVALMLDVSGSMRGQRLSDLQSAANRLIDTLIPVSGSGDVRISLAPYSTAVNAGAYGDIATGITDLYAHTVENLGADPNKLVDALVTSGTSEIFDLIDAAGNNGLGALPPGFFACASATDPVPISHTFPYVCEIRGENGVGADNCSQWSSGGRDIYHLPESMFPVRTSTHLYYYYNDGYQYGEPNCWSGCPYAQTGNITDYTYEDVHGGTVPADCIDGSGTSSQTAADWQALDWNAASLSYTDYDWSVLGAAHAANIGMLNCVTERPGAQAFTNVSPVTYPVGAKASACPRSAVEPLTHNKTILKDAIASLNADGWTAGHLGIAWSWYTLSPDWSAAWPFNRRTEHGGTEEVSRFAILMTDGSFNTYYESGLGNSRAQAASLCDAMKADGIQIYSVAFNAPASSKTTLQDCASTGANYFEATTGSELLAVYDKIAANLDQVRLTQ